MKHRDTLTEDERADVTIRKHLWEYLPSYGIDDSTLCFVWSSLLFSDSEFIEYSLGQMNVENLHDFLRYLMRQR